MQAQSGNASMLNEQEAAVLSWAALRVEQHIVERALLGELNVAVASILLKDWGYGLKQESEAPCEVKVVLEDPEGFGG